MKEDSAFKRHLALQTQITDGHYDMSAIQRMLNGSFMPLKTYDAVIDIEADGCRHARLRELASLRYRIADTVGLLERAALDFTQDDLPVTAVLSTIIQPCALRSDLAARSEDLVEYCKTKNVFQGGFVPFYWALHFRTVDCPLIVALETRGIIDGKTYVVCADATADVFARPYDTVWPAGTAFVLWRPAPVGT